MRVPIYQIDAFTDKLFGGNPAAVCPLEAWLPEATMQAIAAENNLAETAFFVPDGVDYTLRWFTPTVEVDSAGMRHSHRRTSSSSFLNRNARACVSTRSRPAR
jgi:PhzF family phenazine biosynthesis protein